MKNKISFSSFFIFGLFFFLLIIIAFFSQRKLHYPASASLLLFFILYILRYGKLSFFIKTGFLKVVFIYGIMIFFTSIYYIQNPWLDENPIYMFSYSLTWVICIYFTFTYCIRATFNVITLFRFLGLSFFLCGIIYNIYAYKYYRLVLEMSQYNVFYFVIMPLPLLFLYNKKLFQYVFIAISMFFSVLSLKRSAIIACSLIFLFVFIYDLFFLKAKFKLIKISILLLFIVGVFSYLLTTSEFLIILKRFENVNNDGGSGRLEIYSFVIKEIKEFNVFEFFFGKGYSAYKYIYGRQSSTHNDWLEVMFSYGLIGLLSFVFFLCFLIKRFIFLLKKRSELCLAYGISILILIVYSLFGSVFYYQIYSIPLFVFWGLGEFIYVKNIKKITK